MAKIAHGAMVTMLLEFGLISGMRLPYYAGVAVIAGCLVYEHRLAGKGDPVSVNASSLRVNGVISVVFLAAVLADVFFR